VKRVRLPIRRREWSAIWEYIPVLLGAAMVALVGATVAAALEMGGQRTSSESGRTQGAPYGESKTVPPKWISVGPNVPVSADFQAWEHTEYMADSDPTRPGGLLVCSMTFSPSRNQLASVVYASEDAGAHWKAVLRDTTARFGGVWDPACAYGADGSAYFAALVTVDTAPPLTPSALTYERWPTTPERTMPLYRSSDGGRSWSLLTRLGFLDNEDITVDRTAGRFAGRIYLYGNNNRGEKRDLWLLHSSDGGRTFAQSARTTLSDTTYSDAIHAGPGVVTAAGTLGLPFYLERRGATVLDRTLTLAVARSTDGGAHISEPAPIAVVPFCARTKQTTEGLAFGKTGRIPPMMAADHSSGPFRSRSYIAWGQMLRDHCTIMAAYSDDDGRSWSKPVRVSDEPPRAAGAPGPDAFLPTIAVNNEGIVGLTWYDRREDASDRSDRLRFSASLDGGESWSPSVPVSRRANLVSTPPRYPAHAWVSGGGARRAASRTSRISSTVALGPRLYEGWNDVHGDYAGIAVGTDGRFHAFWIDNRTGVAQLYTAAVNVSARPEPDAGASRGGLENVTPLVELQHTSSVYDAVSKTLALEYRLLNTSSDTITAPLRLRITALDSDLGAPLIERIVTPDESLGMTHGVAQARAGSYIGTGTAIFDLTDAISASGLAPGMTTTARTLRIRFSAVTDLSGARRWNDILRFDVTVYGVWRRGVRSPPSRQ